MLEKVETIQNIFKKYSIFLIITAFIGFNLLLEYRRYPKCLATRVIKQDILTDAKKLNRPDYLLKVNDELEILEKNICL